MRVLFLTDAKFIGGSEIYLREMLPRLRQMGVEAEAAMPLAEGNASIRQALMEAGVPVYAYATLNELPQNFDRVLASAWYPWSYQAFFKYFPQLTLLVHDQVEVFYPFGLRYAYRLGYRILQVPNLRRAEKVITVSRWAAEWLQKVHKVRNVSWIPNGVDVNRFRPPWPGERETLRESFAFKGFTVLVPARMSPEKNHMVVFQVAKLLPEAHFVLVGTGELMSLWRKMVSFWRLKNVSFLGRRSDIADLYRAVDATLLPTLGENQSLATLESMASGLPVVTSRIPSQEELITDGENGFLAWGARAFANCLQVLTKDPERRRAMGKKAREFVLRNHRIEQSVASLIKYLESQHIQERGG